MKSNNFFIRIENGNLALPLNTTGNRFFSKKYLLSKMENISSKVGGNIIKTKNDSIVKALNDINLNLMGDRVALLGHNGAGKTTLLKALAGIYPLSSGKIYYKGRISPFIDTGVGVNPEDTSIEFLTYQAMLRGYSKNEIDNFVNEVLDFIELGEFAYMPIRSYFRWYGITSFASAALFFPCEILLLDEGIGAGDQFFTNKFQNKLILLKIQKYY